MEESIALSAEGQSQLNRCNRCGQHKPASEFHKDKRHSTGLYSACKECGNMAFQKWYHSAEGKSKRRAYNEKNRDRTRELQKVNRERPGQKLIHKKFQDKSRSTLRGFLRMKLNAGATWNKKDPVTKQRLTSRKSLNVDFLVSLFEKQRGLCAITGDRMTHICGKGRINSNLSLDRIDSSRGYEPDNIQLACWYANRLKLTYGNEELVAICRKVVAWSERND